MQKQWSLLFIITFFSLQFIFCQTEKKHFTLALTNFSGTILEHNKDISHLITAHPSGLILSLNTKTFGNDSWSTAYNYPDYGTSFIYQDFKNETLGKNYALYAHYNFYFLNRRLMFRIGQGLAYTTNPYDKTKNFRNNAFGTHLLSSTYVMLNYKKPRIIKGFGFQTGITLIHYSNANIKAPNTSVNTLAFNIGVNYVFNEKKLPEYKQTKDSLNYNEKIKLNFAFRSGINESDVINTGQYAFYVFSAYADKRLNRKSAIQLGTDVFVSNFLKSFARYKAVAFPEEHFSGDEDHKRIGLFVGHELFINKMSLITQLGYYVYYPLDFEGRVYNRLGLKRYFGKKYFAALTLKSHAAKAEAVELGIGIRL